MSLTYTLWLPVTCKPTCRSSHLLSPNSKMSKLSAFCPYCPHTVPAAPTASCLGQSLSSLSYMLSNKASFSLYAFCRLSFCKLISKGAKALPGTPEASSRVSYLSPA